MTDKTLNLSLTPEKLAAIKSALPTMSDKQKRKVAELLKRYQAEKSKAQIGRAHV